MSNVREIFCVACDGVVEARYTDGGEVYPHRPDLRNLKFWKCDTCKNHVGTHRTHSRERGVRKPLGSIPTPELRAIRSQVHKFIDPLWVSGRIKRKELYWWLSEQLGYQYHTANLNSEEEAGRVVKLAQRLSKNLRNEGK